MTGTRSFDRAAVALGIASIASVVFAFEGLDDFRFMTVSGASIAVALGLGALAVAAGATGSRLLSVLAGLGFGAAALLQLIATATGADWLGGNLSTMSFWIGLAAGLLISGVAPRQPITDTTA